MSEVRNIPRLRFPEFEKIWDGNLFSDFYEFQTTNSYSRDNLNYEYGKLKNIHYGDIHTKFRTQFIVNNEDVPYINDDIDISKIKTNQILKEGDLVIADASEDYSDIGKSIEIINVDGKKVVAGLHTLHAKSKNRTYVGFGGFMMKSPSVRKSLMMIAQGTKVLGISYKRVSQIKINTPSLSEQQKIADFLTAVDKRIELLENKKTLLETYKKGVLKKIFNQEIRFKDDNGNEFPDWEEKRLGEVCKIQKGKQLNKSELIDTGQYPAINGGINPSGYTDEWNTVADTITISEGGNSCGYVNYIKTNFWCGGHCYSLLEIQNYLQKVYLFEYLKFRESSIMNLRVGSGLPNIQKREIDSFKILIPSINEQKTISSFLSTIGNQIELLETQIDKSKTWKKGLLQKMFV
tara:strand:- start:48 stop:1265 length:1218 start_codon:yes stop_codon:yes gene_type:complete